MFYGLVSRSTYRVYVWVDAYDLRHTFYVSCLRLRLTFARYIYVYVHVHVLLDTC